MLKPSLGEIILLEIFSILQNAMLVKQWSSSIVPPASLSWRRHSESRFPYLRLNLNLTYLTAAQRANQEANESLSSSVFRQIGGYVFPFISNDNAKVTPRNCSGIFFLGNP